MKLVSLNKDDPTKMSVICADSMYGSSVFDGKIKILQMNENEGFIEKEQLEEVHFCETS